MRAAAFVTGGSGFIGGRLVERLVGEGRPVRAFHLAAHLGEWGPWEEFERGNVEGTRNVLAACAEAGVRRLSIAGRRRR